MLGGHDYDFQTVASLDPSILLNSNVNNYPNIPETKALGAAGIGIINSSLVNQ